MYQLTFTYDDGTETIITVPSFSTKPYGICYTVAGERTENTVLFSNMASFECKAIINAEAKISTKKFLEQNSDANANSRRR